MRVVRTDVPPFWTCQACEHKKIISPFSFDEHKPETSTKKVLSVPEKSVRVLEGPKRPPLASRFHFKETRVDMGRTHYLSCEEATNLSSGSNKPSKTPFRSAHGSPKSMPPPPERTTQHERSKSLEPELKQPFRQQSASLNEKVVLPFTNKHDATPSIKSPEHLRQPILQQSTCLKEKVVMSFHNKGGATRSIKSPVRTRTLAELTGQKEKVVQPSQNRVDDATPPVNPPKSSTTKRKMTERPRIEAVPSIKVADVGREVVMAKSPKATENP